MMEKPSMLPPSFYQRLGEIALSASPDELDSYCLVHSPRYEKLLEAWGKQIVMRSIDAILDGGSR
jgi:hypothetical protein